MKLPRLINRPERGIALVLALTTVAVAAMVLTPATVRDRLAVAGTALHLDAVQIQALASGVEFWASSRLLEDLKGPPVDWLGEPWATPAEAAAGERGWASGRLYDLRGRLNLNAIVDERGQVNQRQLARLRRLLRHLELEVTLASAVVDWIDADDDPYTPGGAESAVYLSLKPKLRAANMPFSSVTELRLLAGMDPTSFAALSPHVSVLDHDDRINLNTATREVLLALSDLGNASAVDEFLERRRAAPLDGMAAIRREYELLDGLTDLQGLTVTSDWFELRARIVLPRTERQLRCALRRVGAEILRTYCVAGHW